MTTRILIGITTCHKAVYPDVLSRSAPTNNALCAEYSRRTWIKDALTNNVDVRFFYGRGGTRDRLWDEVFLDCDDSYYGLVDKVTAMTAWAYDHGYDYFMKVDVDSYVNIKNLLASEFRDWDYTGRGWGLGYILSRTAMNLVAEAKQRRSWAEDSHVLKTLFAWGEKSPTNKIKLYGDGRYLFLPNLLKVDVPLYDTTFIVANPMTPERMESLHKTHSLRSILPISFTAQDLWTAGDERVNHSRVFNAFVVRGEKCPLTYTQWAALTPYERQPYVDWMKIVSACAETEQLDKCPTFAFWTAPVFDPESRKKILKWASDVIAAVDSRMQTLSKEFKSKSLPRPEEVLIAIVSCQKYQNRLRDLKWPEKAIAAGYRVEVFDGPRLGVPDDYLSLPQKMKAVCQWADAQGFKAMLKVDDDTEIFLENFEIVPHDYAGIGVLHNDDGLPEAGIPDFPKGTHRYNYASGGAYWLSGRAIRYIAEAPLSNDWAEDRWVGQVLGKEDIGLVTLSNYTLIGRPDANSKDLAVLTQTKGLVH